MNDRFEMLELLDEWVAATMRVVVTLAVSIPDSRRLLVLTAKPGGSEDPIAFMFVGMSREGWIATLNEFKAGGCPLNFARDFWLLAEDCFRSRISGHAIGLLHGRLTPAVDAERARRGRDRTLRRTRTAGRMKSNGRETN